MRRWYATNEAGIKAMVAAVMGIVSVTVIVILWLFATFPTKEAIAEKERDLSDKVEKIDQKVEKIGDRTIEILREMRRR